MWVDHCIVAVRQNLVWLAFLMRHDCLFLLLSGHIHLLWLWEVGPKEEGGFYLRVPIFGRSGFELSLCYVCVSLRKTARCRDALLWESQTGKCWPLDMNTAEWGWHFLVWDWSSKDLKRLCWVVGCLPSSEAWQVLLMQWAGLAFLQLCCGRPRTTCSMCIQLHSPANPNPLHPPSHTHPKIIVWKRTRK